MNDFETCKFGVGLIFVIILVKILKNTIKQPRPVMLKGSTWGMPSSRAACLFFTFTFLILMGGLSQTMKYILLGYALLGCAFKYVGNEHSLIQLTVGALVGMGMAKCIEKL